MRTASASADVYQKLLGNNQRASAHNYNAKTDVWEHTDADATRDDDEDSVQEREQREHMKAWVLSSLVMSAAVIASAVAFGVGVAVPTLGAWKAALLEMDLIPKLPASILWNVCLLFLARFLVQLEPHCAGSGIPEVMSMLHGFKLQGVLDWKVGAAKAVGLTFALSAGMPIGTEGPFVHFSACTAVVLLACPPFQSRLDFRKVLTSVLLAMVSVGSGATLSAPIGGALFGLELMLPHVLTMYSYWEFFAAASMGSLCAVLLKMQMHRGNVSMFTTDVKPSIVQSDGHMLRFLALCLPLAVLCGFLGSAFVNFQHNMAVFHKSLRLRVSPLVIDLLYLAVAGTLVVLLTDYEPQYGMGTPVIMNKLFSTSDLGTTMMGIDIFPGLALLFFVKFVMTAVCIRLPVPTGCVAPVLVMGAILGRFYGHLVVFTGDMVLMGESHHKQQDFAWLSIIGACAFTASVCRTYSIVVTVFELLGQQALILPLSLATLVSIGVSDRLAPSIFDSISAFKSLPHLVGRQVHKSMLYVDSVMRTKFIAENYALFRKQKISELSKFIDDYKSRGDDACTMIGILERDDVGDDHLLLGAVKSKLMISFLGELIGNRSPDEVVDVFKACASEDILQPLIQVKPGTLLREVALKVLVVHPGTKNCIYVCDHGALRGVVPYSHLQLHTKIHHEQWIDRLPTTHQS